MKRADEMERKLRFFEAQIEKLNNEEKESGAQSPVVTITPRSDILDAEFLESKMNMDELEVHSV